jgi:hypothetical protein
MVHAGPWLRDVHPTVHDFETAIRRTMPVRNFRMAIPQSVPVYNFEMLVDNFRMAILWSVLVSNFSMAFPRSMASGWLSRLPLLQDAGL